MKISTLSSNVLGGPPIAFMFDRSAKLFYVVKTFIPRQDDRCDNFMQKYEWEK